MSPQVGLARLAALPHLKRAYAWEIELTAAAQRATAEGSVVGSIRTTGRAVSQAQCLRYIPENCLHPGRPRRSR